MLLLPRWGVLIVRPLFVKVRFVLVVVKGEVVDVPGGERRIADSRDEFDVAGGGGGGGGGGGVAINHPYIFAWYVYASHWFLTAGAVKRLHTDARTIGRAHLVERGPWVGTDHG